MDIRVAWAKQQFCLRHLSPRNQNGSVREHRLKCRVVRNREGLFVADRQVVHRRKQEQVAIRRNLLRCLWSHRRGSRPIAWSTPSAVQWFLSYLAGGDELQRAQSDLEVGSVGLEVVESTSDAGLELRGVLPRRAVGSDLVQGGGRHLGRRVSEVSRGCCQDKKLQSQRHDRLQHGIILSFRCCSESC